MGHLPRPLPGLGEDAVAVFQQLPADFRVRVEEEGKDIGLGIPEVVALVAFAGETLGRYIGAAVPAHGLEGAGVKLPVLLQIPEQL